MTRICIDCGCEIDSYIKFSKRCNSCRCERHAARIKLASRAHYKVRKAVLAGALPDLKKSEVSCVDCGGRATVYDHRDYSRPLDVVPVCKSCNTRRPNAVQVIEFLAGSPSWP